MSKRKSNPRKGSSENSEDTNARLPPPVGYPEHKGTPLRPKQFPQLAEVAQLAATLAQGQIPHDDAAAASLVGAALRLWRVARDEINQQSASASLYWSRMDDLENDKISCEERINQRLEKLGASDLLKSKDKVTWKEAASLLWKNANSKDRDANLARIVSQHLVGKSSWSTWTLANFREFGFNAALSFPRLVAIFDAEQTEAERRAKSEAMSNLGKKSGKARRESAPPKSPPKRLRTTW
jgi:hypothetical protein